MSRDRAHMAAIGREGGESRSRASRQARDGSETDGSSTGGEREMTRSVSREGGSADRNAGSGQGSFGSSDSRDLRSDSPRGSGQPSDGR